MKFNGNKYMVVNYCFFLIASIHWMYVNNNNNKIKIVEKTPVISKTSVKMCQTVSKCVLTKLCDSSRLDPDHALINWLAHLPSPPSLTTAVVQGELLLGCR